ncbi:unnamed protein product [Effrenium voratum]|nr:unnamed protein product [Effrenium voratum]
MNVLSFTHCSHFDPSSSARRDPMDQWPLMTDEQSPVRELRKAREELQLLWRTTPLNRYFLPLSKAPPSPVQKFSGQHPPRCCPKAGASRSARLLVRWASVPSVPPSSPAFKGATDPKEEIYLEEFSPCRKQQRLRGGRSPQQKLTAEGKEFPFIPCTCCERKSPMPMLTKQALGGRATLAISQYAEARPEHRVHP